MEQEIRTRLHAVKKRDSEAARAAGRDPEEILLVAATKAQGDDRIRAAVRAGVTACGKTGCRNSCAIWRPTRTGTPKSISSDTCKEISQAGGRQGGPHSIG
jgi:hypothetical protein